MPIRMLYSNHRQNDAVYQFRDDGFREWRAERSHAIFTSFESERIRHQYVAMAAWQIGFYAISFMKCSPTGNISYLP